MDPKCLRASVPIIEVDELGNKEIQVMPLDDEEAMISNIYPSKRTVQIDELDKIGIQRRYTYNPQNDVTLPHQMIFEDSESVLGSEHTKEESSFDSLLLSSDAISTTQSTFSDEDSDAGSKDIVLGMSEDQNFG